MNEFKQGSFNHIQNVETDFDEAAVWDNIQQPKKRRMPFWIWFGAGSFVVAMGVLFYFPKGNASVDLTKVDEAPKAMQEQQKVNEIKAQVSPVTDLKTTNSRVKTAHLTKVNDAQKTISNEEQTRVSNLSFELAKEPLTNFTSKGITSLSANEHQTQNEIDKLIHSQEQLPIFAFLPFGKSYLTSSEFEQKSKTEIRKRRAPFFQSVSAYMSIGKPFSTFESNGTTAVNEMFQLRNANTKDLEMFSFGVSLRKRIYKNWNLSAGLEFEQLNEHVRFSKERINIGSSDSTYLIETKIFTYQNYHKRTNIPLLFSYQSRLGKLRFVPQAGVVLNLKTMAQGHIQDSEGVPVELSEFYKTQIGLSIRLGARLEHPISKKMSIYLNPNFTWNQSDLMNQSSGLFHRMQSVRLEGGVTRRF